MKLYSKQGLWTLFLICAFPLHVWTIVLAFRDFSWVTDRTNSWDAIGVVSYGLIFAFIESALVFLVAVLLGFLVSRKWAEDRRVALVGSLVFITCLWAVVSYLFFMLNISIPGETILFFPAWHIHYAFYMRSAWLWSDQPWHSPLIWYCDLIIFSGVSGGSFERISTLTLFYLFFDFLGLVIVIVRNV